MEIYEIVGSLQDKFPHALFTKQHAVEIGQKIVNQYIEESEIQNVTVRLSLVDFDSIGDTIIPIDTAYFNWNDIKNILMGILSEIEEKNQ